MRLPDEDVDKNLNPNDVNDYGEYLKLSGDEIKEGEGSIVVEGGNFFCWRWWWSVVWYWVKLALLFTSLCLLALFFVKWVAPFLMDKVLIPIINWERKTFSTPELAVLLFATIALFPSLLLPTSPSMWASGMTFGYGYGFLLVLSAVAVGVSLPYFIGALFRRKIQGWLEKYPNKAAMLRAAGEGTWFHQFKTVTLIRISPFPYILYNYCSVATNVKYSPYIAGSLAGMLPDVLLAIYTGILVKTLADAEQHSLSAEHNVSNVVYFCTSVMTLILVTIYAKWQLNMFKDAALLS